MERRKGGAPIGHPPYRPARYTVRVSLLLTPEMEQQIQRAAEAGGVSILSWIRAAIEARLKGGNR
jgi:predicted HicB family RNase H-like nuclease